MTAVEIRDSMDELEYHANLLRERGYNAEAAEFDALYLVQAHRLEIEVAAALVEIELRGLIEEGMTFE